MSARQIAIIYALVGLAWIVGTDTAKRAAGISSFRDAAVDVAKGSLYVLATAAFVYWLVNREFRRRSQIEDALRRGEERLRAIFESHPSPMLTVHPETRRILEANSAAAAFYGSSAEELKRKTLGDVEPDGGGLRGTREGLRQALHFTAAGEQRTVDVHERALRLGEHTVSHLLIHDVTRREEFAREVDTLFQLSRDLIAVSRPDGYVLRVNPAWTAILGHDEDDVLGEGAERLIHPEDLDSYRKALEWQSQGHSLVGFINRFRTRDEAYKWISWNSVPNNNRIYAVGRDVTEMLLDKRHLSRVNAALRALAAANRALASATAVEEIPPAVCRALAETANYPLVWIGRAEKDSHHTIHTVASSGAAAARSHLERAHLTWAASGNGSSLAGRALREGKTQFSRSLETDESLRSWRDQAKAHGFRSALAVPVDGRHLGKLVLSVYSSEEDDFSEREVEMFESLASDIAYSIRVIASVTRYDKAERGRLDALTRLQTTFIQSVKALSVAAEKRDPYTAGHQSRVAAIAEMIGQTLGMEEHRLLGLRLGALLHDTGKVAIPLEILAKPGKLSDLEMSLVRLHPQIGYEIIREVEFEWPIGRIVLEHHERYDGTGYPKGLKGEEILLEARIVSVADVLESIHSHRPYRPALGIEEAWNHVLSKRGTWYDPDVVDACADLKDEFAQLLR